jgi:kinesin family protein 11
MAVPPPEKQRGDDKTKLSTEKMTRKIVGGEGKCDRENLTTSDFSSSVRSEIAGAKKLRSQ